jgi:hypothetical protein
MIERRFLRVPQIMQDGARRRYRQRLAPQAASIQRQQVKMLAQRAVGIIQAEDPVIQCGPQSRHILCRLCRQHLSHVQILERRVYIRDIQLGRVKFAG